MKKNAVIIASILFATGCATHDHRTASSSESYGTSHVAESQSTGLIERTPQAELLPPPDPSLSSQYDPASSGNFGASVSGSASGSSGNRNELTSVEDYHADSSIRGGSNEARGVAREGLPTEGPGQPLNPAYQADSSIRGGSAEARDPEARGTDLESSSIAPNESPIKADSSIRGGSNQARQIDDHQSSVDTSTGLDSASSFEAGGERDDFGRSKADKTGALLGSANWNASDDLMKDGTDSVDQSAVVQRNNDASLEGAVSADSGALPELGSKVPSDYSFSTEAVGGPGSIQTGSSTSADASADSTILEPEQNDGLSLFRNNRAQGIGSGTTGELESNSSELLSQRVRGVLTREATDRNGTLRPDLAKNVRVSSHGSTIVLSGTVPTQRDKDMIEFRAREISGVQRVSNQIVVSEKQ